MIDQTILVDLDAILDTRLATMSKIDVEAAIKAVADDRYRNRLRDDWDIITEGRVSKERFKEEYARRDVETLKRAMMTPMVKLVAGMTKAIQWRAAAQVDVRSITLLINTWPYVDLNKEQLEMYVACMSMYCAASTQIRTVCLSLEDLTPKRLDKTTDIWVTYAYDEWLTLHLKGLAENPIWETTLLTAQIMHNPVALKEEDLSNKETGEVYDPFVMHQAAMAEFIGIEFHPALAFSMVHS